MISHHKKGAMAVMSFLFLCTLFLTGCDELIGLLAANTDVVAVTGATITPDSSTLEVGENLQYSVFISPEDATDSSVTWSSSDTTVAEINTSGYLTTKDTGTATIKATTTDGGYYDESNVTVEAATPETVSVTGVTVSPKSSSLDVDDTVQLSATVDPSDADDTSLTWTSSAPSVASVNASTGLVTAEASGSAVITATTTDGSFTDTAAIAVEVPIVSVTSVEVTPETATLEVDGTVQLSAAILPSDATNSTVTWSSSKTNVATVNTSGLVTAIAGGSAIITVEANDGSGEEATAVITVNYPVINVTGVTVSPEAYTLEVDGTVQLYATVEPSDATNSEVTWSSSTPSVASVNESTGMVTAKANGTATITATTTDGAMTATAVITVETTAVTIGSKDIKVSYALHDEYGTDTRPTIGGGFLYAIWLENAQGDMQHIYVCNKVKNGSLNSATDNERVLPFWHINRYNSFIKDDADLKAEVDAVTGSTPSYSASYRNFDKSITIDTDTLGTEFTLYFEIDQSWEENAWFTDSTYDQPAVLYSVEINLENIQATPYDLDHIGWTPMYEYSSYSSTINLTSDDIDDGFIPTVGELVKKPEYITKALETVDGRTEFSDTENLAQSCIRCIGSITATITDTITE